MNLPEAKSLPYWKTSNSAPETWVRKACAEIERADGVIEMCLPSAQQHGRIAHVIQFVLDEEEFRLMWPVAEHDPDDQLAALRQAATMLYHDVKSRCLKARVFGARWAFQAELLLPDGRTAGQLSTPELVEALPPVALISYEGSKR